MHAQFDCASCLAPVALQVLLAAPLGLHAKSSVAARNGTLLAGMAALVGADLCFAFVPSLAGALCSHGLCWGRRLRSGAWGGMELRLPSALPAWRYISLPLGTSPMTASHPLGPLSIRVPH